MTNKERIYDAEGKLRVWISKDELKARKKYHNKLLELELKYIYGDTEEAKKIFKRLKLKEEEE